MFEKGVMCGIYVLTPLHAGSGIERNSAVDLPIQREKHTSFPVVYGQSLKGVLRSRYDKDTGNSKETYAIFGPDTERASMYSGAICVTDARILLFPVRSLKGVFAYVTCPFVLNRFMRDLEIMGKSENIDENLFKVGENEALVSKNSSIVADNQKVILEDVILEYKNVDLSSLTKIIKNILPVEVEDRIAIVSDDLFKQFATMTTEVVARIKIDQVKGTVDSLWYEEYLPPDAVLYFLILAKRPHQETGVLNSAEEIISKLSETFNNKIIQIGGNETVGKGFVKIKMWRE